jgi:hypothetical protein
VTCTTTSAPLQVIDDQLAACLKTFQISPDYQERLRELVSKEATRQKTLLHDSRSFAELVSNLEDLLLYSLDDLEEIAAEKGGMRQLLDETWCKV